MISTGAIGTIHSLDRVFEFRNLLAASAWNEHGNTALFFMSISLPQNALIHFSIGNSALVDYYIHASLDATNDDMSVEQIEVATCMLAMQVSVGVDDTSEEICRAENMVLMVILL